MIIPINCFTCGTVIDDKYMCYLEEVARKKQEMHIEDTDPTYFIKGSTKSIEGHVMDSIGIKKPCCRRHFLTHVDIE